LLLRTRWTSTIDEEPGKVAQFAFGLVPLPDRFVLEAVSRSAELEVRVPGSPATDQFIQMQSDLRGQASFGKLRVNASIAYAQSGAQAAALTTRPLDNVVSREHWVGWDATDGVLVRAGRVTLPFGARVIEHNLWARSETRTDINQYQQDGLAVSVGKEGWRAELMA